MPSGFPKFMWPITIPTGGWDFAVVISGSTSVATLDAGTEFDTIYDLLSGLETELETETSDTWTTSFKGGPADGSDWGRAILNDSSNDWTWDTSNTDNALSVALGLDESSDTVSSQVLKGSLLPYYMWTPGWITWGRGRANGSGVTDDSLWTPDWPLIHTISGGGNARIVTPSRAKYTRDITLDIVNADEITDPNNGLAAFIKACANDVFWYFSDRETGDVGWSGVTQLDPHDAEEDTSANYTICTFDGPRGFPRWRKHPMNPDYYIVSISMVAEGD